MYTILVIEDDDILSENIALLLESENYNVAIAKNGVEGLNLIEKLNPDLIVCDINMPKMDGFALKERLNSSKHHFDIPLLFLTAKTNPKDLRKGMGMGADDYIFKPYDSNELLNIIKLRIEKHKNTIEKIKFSITNNNDKRYKLSDSFFLKGGTKSYTIKISHIKIILSDSQYSTIILSNNKKLTMRISLNEWENKLPNDTFKRIHRSAIVNFNFVESLSTVGENHILKIKDWKNSLPVSRRKYSLLKLKQ